MAPGARTTNEEGGNELHGCRRIHHRMAQTLEASLQEVAMSLQSESSHFQLCRVLLHGLMNSLLETTHKLKYMLICLAPRESQSELILILLDDGSLGKIKQPVMKESASEAGLMQGMQTPAFGGSEWPLAKVIAEGIQSPDGDGLSAPFKVPSNPKMFCFSLHYLPHLPHARHPRRC